MVVVIILLGVLTSPDWKRTEIKKKKKKKKRKKEKEKKRKEISMRAEWNYL